MKWWIPVLGVIAASTGCQTPPKQAPQAATHSVLDVAPRTASASAPSAYEPPTRLAATSSTSAYAGPVPVYLPPNATTAYQPQTAAVRIEATPAPAAAPIPVQAVEQAPVASAETQYTVRHGDTLFRIAKQQYGDGKKWRQIASANPGVTPASLKVGQKLVMP